LTCSFTSTIRWIGYQAYHQLLLCITIKEHNLLSDEQLLQLFVIQLKCDEEKGGRTKAKCKECLPGKPCNKDWRIIQRNQRPEVPDFKKFTKKANGTFDVKASMASFLEWWYNGLCDSAGNMRLPAGVSYCQEWISVDSVVRNKYGAYKKIAAVWEQETKQESAVCSDQQANAFWQLKLKDGRLFSEAKSYNDIRAGVYGNK
jgi:hypothetical protein